MADCIASLACDRFEMDEWGVDVLVAACQKGLMTPPGLGFVFFSPRAAAARDRMARVSRYWDWRPRTEPDGYYQYFCGTAPTHHIYGLRAALDMIAEEGLEARLGPARAARGRRLGGLRGLGGGGAAAAERARPGGAQRRGHLGRIWAGAGRRPARLVRDTGPA